MTSPMLDKPIGPRAGAASFDRNQPGGLTAQKLLSLVRTWARNDAQRTAVDSITPTPDMTLRAVTDALLATGQISPVIIQAALNQMDGTGASGEVSIPNIPIDTLLDDLEESGTDGTGSADVSALIGEATSLGLLIPSEVTGDLLVAGNPAAVLDRNTGLITQPGYPNVPVADLLSSPILGQVSPDAVTGTYSPSIAESAYRVAVAAGAATDGPIPYGVPTGFVQPKPFYPSAETVYPGGIPQNQRVPAVPVERFEGPGPRYFRNPDTGEDTAWDPYAHLTPENIAVHQAALVEAGYLLPGQFTEGQWGQLGSPVHQAMQAAQGDAMVAGAEVLTYLRSRRDNPVTNSRTFVPDVYRAPDPANVANDVRSLLRSKIGREPSQDDINGLLPYLSDAYREQYDAQQEAARLEFEAQTTAASGGTAAPAGIVETVSPLDRLDSIINERFGPQITRARESEERRDPNQTISQALRFERRR